MSCLPTIPLFMTCEQFSTFYSRPIAFGSPRKVNSIVTLILIASVADYRELRPLDTTASLGRVVQP